MGAAFSTYDVDNYHGGVNCNISFRGAWWYKDCANVQNISFYYWAFPGCQNANLNGQYNGPYGAGVVWATWTGYSLNFVEMKLRPTTC